MTTAKTTTAKATTSKRATKAKATKASEQVEASEQLSIAEIAERCDNMSQKTIRAFLRSNHSRSLELKNSRWGDASNNYKLSAELTAELLKRYQKQAK